MEVWSLENPNSFDPIWLVYEGHILLYLSEACIRSLSSHYSCTSCSFLLVYCPFFLSFFFQTLFFPLTSHYFSCVEWCDLIYRLPRAMLCAHVEAVHIIKAVHKRLSFLSYGHVGFMLKLLIFVNSDGSLLTRTRRLESYLLSFIMQISSWKHAKNN